MDKHNVTTEDLINKLCDVLKKHEDKCDVRHNDTMKELYKKAEFTTGNWILLMSLFLVAGLGITGAFGTTIFYTAGMAERIAKVEVGIDNLKSSHIMLSDKIDERFEKVDERLVKMDQRFEKIDQRFEKIDEQFEDLKDIIIQTRNNTSDDPRQAQSSQ